MGKYDKTLFRAPFIILACSLTVLGLSSCKQQESRSRHPSYTKLLADTLQCIAADYPGEIGVALIINNTDTITVNNKNTYPMMSVFKVHQALAVCNKLDRTGSSLDDTITIKKSHLDPTTWSPMLKEHAEPQFSLTIKELLCYTLTQSDNNASNLMFKKLAGVTETDRFIATLIPRTSFQIAYTEEDMSAVHARAYSNRTSPLGAAILMNRLFTDNIISSRKQRFIMNMLKECATGKDRIVAPLPGKEAGVAVAHKTGSGYVNKNGELVAHNDVAYIRLPDNVSYTLAVFVKNFKGDEAQASKAIARISATVYESLSRPVEQP